MKSIKFTIYGKPFAKQRPKFARMGKYVKTYTPKETIEFENYIRLSFRQHLNGDDFKLITEPVKMIVKAFFPIPKSTSKKIKETMKQENIPHIKKPDWDNLGKIVSDALNKIAYSDDGQVYDSRVTKYYSETPRTEIEIIACTS